MVAFGDSLTDMGNRSVAPHKTDVKFRDTWVRQLASPEMLNIPDFKPSGLSFYYGGTNYAVGGATTEYTARIGSSRNRGQHLTQQISKRYLNRGFNTDGVKPDALHIVVIGANDLMLASVSPEQIFSNWIFLNDSAVAIARSAEGQIQALAAAGVRHILWGNVFDVAQAPAVVARANFLGQAKAPPYLAALTQASLAYNREMDAAILRLHQAYPSLNLIKLDLFARFAEIITAPEKNGFSTVKSGANDNKHLFSADGLHPTYAGHRMLAKYALNLIKPFMATSQAP